MSLRYGHRLSFVLVGALACAVVSPSAAGPVAVSTFDVNNEGWQIVTTLGYIAPAEYADSGGNPGGFIWGADPDTGAWGFAAPAKFLGDVSAAYGQELTFDIEHNNPDPGSGWVGINGAGMDLVCPFAAPSPAWTWCPRSVVMTETAGWVDPITLLPPTQAQMQAVLSDLAGLVITGEYVDGLGSEDMSGLDNVILAPEPVTLLLLGAGVPLVLRRRRSSRR